MENIDYRLLDIFNILGFNEEDLRYSFHQTKKRVLL